MGVASVAAASLLVAGCQAGTAHTSASAAPAGTVPSGTTAAAPATPAAEVPAAGTTARESPGPSSSPDETTATPNGGATRELPRGGTELFPRYRLVGYSGGAAKSFGRLGIGDLQNRAEEIEKLGAQYDSDGREAMPVMELIATVVQASPGKDGKYRARTSDAEIGRYLKAARRNKALLLLNIQPGRADFLTEVKAMQKWLAEPDVGIALDPEWAVGPGQRPGHVYGRTSAAELNEVSLWLSEFVTEHRLPQKAFVVHQLAPRIISDVPGIRVRKNLAFVLSVDGIGGREDKEKTWRKLVEPLPEGIHTGFKLFYEEDREHGRLMTPKQVLGLKPKPEYVLYE
ncbi:hypothetical protein KIH74_33040 [Kineosporia sp. J2-2]|uniref:Lipoprotein n=1 Tax=Kineosporia corallincola TaxID=2835133 RepID=A0ABS5TSN9_9ACTN|nr:hypothetical protein [Kineosporia corallincola]MBT0773819.1 hypothetical protein [Kineosporia corallincola]